MNGVDITRMGWQTVCWAKTDKTIRKSGVTDMNHALESGEK